MNIWINIKLVIFKIIHLNNNKNNFYMAETGKIENKIFNMFNVKILNIYNDNFSEKKF